MQELSTETLVINRVKCYQGRSWQRQRNLAKNLANSAAAEESTSIPLERVRDRWNDVVDMEGGDFPESNHEAMADMVAKVDMAAADGKGQGGGEATSNDNGAWPQNQTGTGGGAGPVRFCRD